MSKKVILVLALSYIPIILLGQTINFVFPKESNKSFSFTIHNGLLMDTVAQGTISMLGIGKVVVPEKYKSIPATGTLNIAGRDPLTLVVDNESFTMSENEEGKISFKGSLENDLLYNKQNELAKEEYHSTFAYEYMKMMSSAIAISKVLGQTGVSNMYDKNTARHSALTNVDMDKLYYTKFWYFIIDGLMRLSAGEEGFANDMVKLLDKTKTDHVYVKLVEDLIMITNQFGMDDAFDIIIPHVEASKRIEYPQGAVFDAFAMAKVRKGVEAPKLEGLKVALGRTNDRYSLLIFHQPGCHNCEQQLEILVSKYDSFVKNKIRIITVSGSLDKGENEKESSSFLWNDKLCDYKGFAGANFLNFGIIGTPTMYLLDNKNIVLGRFSLISEIEKRVRGAQK